VITRLARVGQGDPAHAGDEQRDHLAERGMLGVRRSEQVGQARFDPPAEFALAGDQRRRELGFVLGRHP
jgi:hypothetical protein